MRIGIWLGDKVVETDGGGASYINRLLHMIDKYSFSKDVELCYISIYPQENLVREIINISQIPSFLYRFFSFSVLCTKVLRKLDNIIIRKKGMYKILRGTGVKILFYPQPGICMDSHFPFISNVWDIGHRCTHSFPELTYYPRRFEKRDHFFMCILPKALLVICESETGKGDIAKYTRIGEHKIRVMPMFAGNVGTIKIPESTMDSVLHNLGLEKHLFFYYPAQFWAHKNHIGLIKAFKEFLSHNSIKYKLVLSGANQGNLDYVKKVCLECGLSDNVMFLGFISEEIVYTLYRNATCLVMASHFGPTNMPPIEAMELGCPVACSDLGGHREILGNNAVYFDSMDYHSISIALDEMVNNRTKYVEGIVNQRQETFFTANNAMKSLDTILLDAITIRSNWE